MERSEHDDDNLDEMNRAGMTVPGGGRGTKERIGLDPDDHSGARRGKTVGWEHGFG